MKKRALVRTLVLSALILLVLVAMHLPWAYLMSDSTPDKTVYYPKLGTYPYSFPIGNIWTPCSFFLALLALFLAPFSGKRRVCGIICGLLLLLSAGAVFYAGATNHFLKYTPLTWAIFASLVLLGLWTLITSFKKPKAQNAEQAAEKA